MADESKPKHEHKPEHSGKKSESEIHQEALKKHAEDEATAQKAREKEDKEHPAPPSPGVTSPVTHDPYSKTPEEGKP